MKTYHLRKLLADSRDQIIQQGDRLVLWAPVCFALGILVYFLPDYEPGLVQILACLVLSFCLSLLILPARFYGLRPVVIACTLGLAGYAAMGLQTHSLSTPLLLERLGPVMVEGRVESIAPGKPGSVRVMLDGVVLDRAPSKGHAPVRLRLSSRHMQDVAVNSHIRIRAMLMPPSPPVLPGGFDFQKKSFFAGFGAVGYTIGKVEITQQAGRGTVSRLRHTINSRIAAALEGDRAALAQALLTGRRKGISEDSLSVIRDAGLAHLLAISGLHIGMVAGLVFFSVRFGFACFPSITLTRPIKKWAALAAMLTAFIYMLLAGATIPTIRAFIMTGLVLLAVMTDRTALTLRLVCIAALLIMLMNPYAVTSVSFQLSFAAVTGLIAFYDSFGRAWMATHFRREWWYRLLLYLGGIILTSLIATAVTAPLTLYYFNRVPVYGILSNIAAIPLMGVWVMPSGLLALLAMPFGLETLPLSVMGQGASAIIAIADWVAAKPFSLWHYPSFSPFWLGGCLFGFVFLCLWRGWWRFIGIPVMLLALFLAPTQRDHQILISSDAAHVAVYQDKAVYLSGHDPDDYMIGQWIEDWGLPKGTETRPFPACDAAGCGMIVSGVRLVHATSPVGLAENCRQADVIIARDPVAESVACDAVLIDRFDVWANGAYAVRVTKGGGIEPTNVQDRRGYRLWTGAGQISKYGTARSKPLE